MNPRDRGDRVEFETQVCRDFPQYNQYRLGICALTGYIDNLERRLAQYEKPEPGR